MKLINPADYKQYFDWSAISDHVMGRTLNFLFLWRQNPKSCTHMKILGIETSCDETAISIIETEGTLKNPQFKVLSNVTLSQAKLHEKYGGVFPNLAKREHSKNLIPVLKQALKESNFLKLEVKKTY